MADLAYINFTSPVSFEQEVGLEVTSYLPAEIDVI